MHDSSRNQTPPQTPAESPTIWDLFGAWDSESIVSAATPELSPTPAGSWRRTPSTSARPAEIAKRAAGLPVEPGLLESQPSPSPTGDAQHLNEHLLQAIGYDVARQREALEKQAELAIARRESAEVRGRLDEVLQQRAEHEQQLRSLREQLQQAAELRSQQEQQAQHLAGHSQTQLAERQQQLEAQRAAAEQAAQVLALQQQELAAARQREGSWESRVAELESQTESLQNALKQRTEIAERAALERDEALSERDEALSKHAQALSERDEALSKHAQALSERDEALSERDEALSERDEALSEHAQALSERDEALSERDEALSERDEALSEHAQALSERAEALDQQRRTSQSRDATAREALQLELRLAELESDLTAARRQVDQAHAEVQLHQREIAELTQQVEQERLRSATQRQLNQAEAESAAQDKTQLQNALTEAAQRLDALHRAHENLLEQSNEQRAQRQIVEAKLAESTAETGRLRRRIESLEEAGATDAATADQTRQLWETQLAEAERRLAASQLERQGLSDQLSENLAQRQSIEANLEVASSEIARLRVELAALQVAREDESSKLEVSQQQTWRLLEERDQLANRQGELEQQLEGLHSEIQRLQQKQADREQELAAMGSESRSLQATLSQRQQELAQARERRRATLLRWRGRARRERAAAARRAVEAERQRTAIQSDRLRTETLIAELEAKLAATCEALEQSQQRCLELDALRTSLLADNQRTHDDLTAAAAYGRRLAQQVAQLEPLQRRLANREHAATVAEERLERVRRDLATLQVETRQQQTAIETACETKAQLEQTLQELRQESDSLRNQRDHWKARLRRETAQRRKLAADLRRVGEDPAAAQEIWRRHENHDLQQRVLRLTGALNDAHRRAQIFRDKVRKRIAELQGKAGA